MPEAQFDCVIRAGRVATALDDFAADIGIKAGSIVAIGRELGPGALEIDAKDRLVLPGGIDAHAHIEQLSAAGIVNSDTFESATTSAALGGTTTAICFAAQHVGMDLMQVVADYSALAKKGAVIDYAFHLIIADPTELTIREQIPALIGQGHATLKVFMTYDRLQVGDEALLDILLAARRSGALVCVHAENHGMISWMGKRLLER
jgi:dihydropyrimidinase